jgi:outer membrane autotransporter protein
MGLYAVWNKEPSGLGYQVRLANTYQDKDVTSTRTVFDTSEAGSGKSSLQSQSYLAELSYAFQYQDKTLVRPYAGLRYTHLKQKGYTEEMTDAVTDPLTFAALRDKSATALLGVKINRHLTDKATLSAQLGLEQDLHHKVGNYSATDLNGSDLTAIAFNSNIKRTRPVASIGAFYDVTKTQRASASINYQQTPFQSTGSTTAYFNYMIGF